MAATTGKQRKRRKFPTHILVFLAPATIIYTLFMIYPMLNSIRLSFYAPTEQFGSSEEVFVGLQNFVTLLTDPLWSERFWGALRNNFIFFPFSRHHDNRQ